MWSRSRRLSISASVRRVSLQEQKAPESGSPSWPLAGDIAGYFELVEDFPDRRQETWQFPGVLRLVLRGVGKRHQLFADQVIQSALGAKLPSDALGGSALLYPDLLEAHSPNIPRQSSVSGCATTGQPPTFAARMWTNDGPEPSPGATTLPAAALEARAGKRYTCLCGPFFGRARIGSSFTRETGTSHRTFTWTTHSPGQVLARPGSACPQRRVWGRGAPGTRTARAGARATTSGEME
jgi:hypothetical protein